MTDKTFKYSEIFTSLQGEGIGVTGEPCVWIRWFMCNLQCNGFGQKDPTDPDTYILPYLDYDLSNTKKVEDLPVWEYGCDTSYSWSKRYKSICPSNTADEIADLITEHLKNGHNPEGKFIHPNTNRPVMLAVTGGEPMLAKSQEATVALIEALERQGNFPPKVMIETNGTQAIKEPLARMIKLNYNREDRWTWSVSPKLFQTSGEERKRAIKPDVVAGYQDVCPNGYLKFVISGTQESWDELEEVLAMFRSAGVTWPVSIMPVGATREDQERPDVAKIATEATARGYHVSARVHAYVYGNIVGV